MKSPDRTLILASASKIRTQLLRNAGLTFTNAPARLDERAVEAPLLEAEIGAAGIAEVLAQAKAQEVSQRHPGAYVIGADQTLGLDDEILHKPPDREAARRRLLQLSDKTHQLHAAACIVHNGELVWTIVDSVHIEFRKLDPGFVGRHLANVGEVALESVGAYQIEGPGIQLMKGYTGDFFSILGLPLLPLLAKLRELEIIDG